MATRYDFCSVLDDIVLLTRSKEREGLKLDPDATLYKLRAAIQLHRQKYALPMDFRPDLPYPARLVARRIELRQHEEKVACHVRQFVHLNNTYNTHNNGTYGVVVTRLMNELRSLAAEEEEVEHELAWSPLCHLTIEQEQQLAVQYEAAYRHHRKQLADGTNGDGNAEVTSRRDPPGRPAQKRKTPCRDSAERSSKQCSHCKTHATGAWRHFEGIVMCNACGVYANNHHGEMRPLEAGVRQLRNNPDSPRKPRAASEPARKQLKIAKPVPVSAKGDSPAPVSLPASEGLGIDVKRMQEASESPGPRASSMRCSPRIRVATTKLKGAEISGAFLQTSPDRAGSNESARSSRSSHAIKVIKVEDDSF
ncbi:hypothetical protein WJX73_002586 [Symbiochloris irregularis]|uniref:GATA-type domain-containing protein n=1 Tax=Symbiochloris irregularis TaxID=706552 RepID=A0AAW1NPA5_9CHLO